MSSISIISENISLPLNGYLNTVQLAQHFNIEPSQLNQIFVNLNWIEKEHYIWWVATETGEKNGAKKYSTQKNKMKYVVWSDEILQNKELSQAIQYYLHTYKDNGAYKLFIEKDYKANGYTVWNHSEEKGVEDRGINFIAKKNREIIFINCRGNLIDVTLEEIIEFENQKNSFLEENPIFIEYNVTLLYAMSGFFISEEAFEYIEEKEGLISYVITR